MDNKNPVESRVNEMEGKKLNEINEALPTTFAKKTQRLFPVASI